MKTRTGLKPFVSAALLFLLPRLHSNVCGGADTVADGLIADAIQQFATAHDYVCNLDDQKVGGWKAAFLKTRDFTPTTSSSLSALKESCRSK